MGSSAAYALVRARAVAQRELSKSSVRILSCIAGRTALGLEQSDRRLDEDVVWEVPSSTLSDRCGDPVSKGSARKRGESTSL